MIAAGIRRTLGIAAASVIALWVGGGAGCRKAATVSSPPVLGALRLSPSSGALFDGGGSVAVAFAVDVFDPDADVAQLVVTVRDVAGGPPKELREDVQDPSGSAKRTLRWNLTLPTTAITTHVIEVQVVDSGGHSSVVRGGFDVVQGSIFALSCGAPGTGFGDFALPPGTGGVLPFVPLDSLKTVANPVIPRDAVTGAPLLRADLAAYVADLPSAIALGKALFWDVQAGSDDLTACATCHHHAGADHRATNQLHPGPDGRWGGHGPAAYGPNFTLTAADFPFTDPLVSRDVDEVAGSQGVRSSTFEGIGPGGVERTTPVVDPVFGSLRRVTAVHAPTAINAVFNSRNFYDGRADYEFNGVSPFGDRQRGAHVWRVLDGLGTVGEADVRLPAASLASQAVGPPLNAVEMSAAGRTFPDLGRKLLPLKALGRQRVSPTDGVLGPLADPAGNGLVETYAALVRRSFHPQWWDTTRTVKSGAAEYALMEANFSLFWGLSVMLYEATLVSDDSPMDRYVASRVFDVPTATLVSDDPALLDPVVDRLAAEGVTFALRGGGARPITRADILAGLDLFEKPLPPPGEAWLPPGTGLGCNLCHAGAETTSASVAKVTTGVEPASRELAAAGFDLRIERMFMGIRTPAPGAPRVPPPVPIGTDEILFDAATHGVSVRSVRGVAVAPQPVAIATYDTGWYNIGVRPTTENLGVGGTDPLGQPLSIAERSRNGSGDSVVRVAGRGLGCVTPGGIPLTPPAAPLSSPFAGEVLAPGTAFPLLSGPLARTDATAVAGSFKTPSLRNVELNAPYLHNGGKATLRQVMELYDGGGDFANATLPPLIRPLALSDDQLVALIAFLVSLTDDRVLHESAPFDHPELPLPSGHDVSGADVITTLPAVGAAGASTPVRRFLGLSPFEP